MKLNKIKLKRNTRVKNELVFQAHPQKIEHVPMKNKYQHDISYTHIEINKAKK